MPADRLLPVRSDPDPRFPFRDAPAALTAPNVPLPEDRPIQWTRYIAALRRFKWVILGITILGSGVGFGVSRFLSPEYAVDATIWISTQTQESRNVGPIRSGELLNNLSWSQLVRSFTILDNVALKERLYLVPEHPEDSLLFASFSLTDRFRAGDYRLVIDGSGQRYELATSKGQFIEAGATGGAIGRALGFQWTPPLAELTPGRTATFLVRTPRSASVDIRNRLDATLREHSTLMPLRLTGTDPHLLASTMNAILNEFVTVAADLKKRNLVEFAGTLARQLAYADRELRDAEIALEDFRVNTITLPSEGPVAGGVELTRDPVFESFFSQKTQADNLRRDRELLTSMLAEIRQGGLDVTTLLAAPAVTGAQALQAALTEYSSKEAQLRAAQVLYTNEHPTVRDLVRALDTLRVRTIPDEASALINRLQRQETDLQSRIAAAARDLRAIPVRSIEEMRLVRNVEVRENLYTMLKNRYEEARLADVSSTPDVSILDPAVAPIAPTRNTAPRILLMAVAGSFAAAIVLVLLLDRVDRRFRYPEQATDELGLNVIGAVPTIKRTGRGPSSVEEGAQIVEAFRTIRLNLQYACAQSGPGPVAVTVASPGADDGKSLICANLALSFAEAGSRTLLIDGDIRRGHLHSAFGVARQPGLVDYLAGEVPLADVLRRSTHERLTIMTCGSRRHRGPELLTSAALPGLIAMLSAQYDAIVIDSAPLGAGIDALALGTVTGNMLVVLRSGETDRRLAQAKLELVHRLSVRVVGAVLNDVPATGPYQYYSYLPGYGSDEDATAPVMSSS